MGGSQESVEDAETWKERCLQLRHLLLGEYVRRWMESTHCETERVGELCVEDRNRAHFDAWFDSLNSYERYFTSEEIWEDYIRFFASS